MKSRLSSLALHPMRWLVASLVAAGVILIAMVATRMAPIVSGALVTLSVGGMAYLVTRSLQAVNRDLQQQLAERTDALNQALVQLQTESSRNRNLLEAIGAIIHSIADSVIVVDRAGAILIANPAAQRLIAPSASEAIGAPLDVWLKGDSVIEEREQVTQSIQMQVQRSGLKVLWAGQRTLSLSLAPVQLHPERQALGMVIVCRDVTREAELDRLKSHFISMVSHELRTPLIGILSQVEVLSLRPSEALPDHQRQAFARIEVNAQHLLRLITDLLDHAQVEAGQVLTLQPVVFSPTQLVSDLQVALLPSAEAKGLTLAIDLRPEVPSCLIGDPGRLRQILFNLVGNAIKFTEHGGVQVQIARLDVEHWLFQVADTGRGIAPDDQARLFEPFYRAGPQAGAGLGLSIVKHLVTLKLPSGFPLTSALYDQVLPIKRPAKKTPPPESPGLIV
jgi:two-component system, OmpR family, phosphate regulon sensor histidine kinase PhoR